jgi:hypothetical protein
MNTRMKELAARREALVAEAGLQRALAGEACAGLRKGLRLADRGLSFLRGLKRKPVVVGLAAAAVTLLIARPRQAVKWLGYCLTAYAMFKRANRLLAPRHSD